MYVLNSTEDFIYFLEGNTNATTIRVRKESGTDGQDIVASKPVVIAFNYEYYAEKVYCSWFRDDTPTEALCGNCTQRYMIRHEWKRDSLTILRPSIWESGRYTVECRVGNGIKRNTSRDVFIEGDWEVTLSPKRVEMVSSDPIELVCRSRGVDSPTFQLYFIECDYQTWDKCRDTGDKEQLETMISSMHRTAFEVYHVFVITPKEFGIVVCEVLSEHGTRFAETILQNSESEAKAILNSKIITKVLAIATVGVLLFVGIVWGYRKYTEGKVKLPKDGAKSTDGAGGESINFLPGVYKISRQQVQLYERLGQGEFGVTWMGKVSGISEDPSLETVVAVKEPKERPSKQMLITLLSELKVHVHVGHHLNVVNLLGAVVENLGEGELLLVMEYCRFGNMKHFLQQNRPHFENNVDDGLFGSAAPESGAAGYPFSTTDLLYWASQIACGMEYLSTSGIIHGDLAARNVLLCEGSIVKIGDFGMARVIRRDDVYRKSDNDALLPLAWMAVESIRDRIFSTRSDVWAYGVLLWELFSLGTEPYSTVLVNEMILGLLTQGYRMEKPAYAPSEIYSLMKSCWEEDPCARPTFKELFDEFNSRLPNRLRKQYARLNEPYMHMSALEKAGSPKTPLRVYVNESVWSPQNGSKAEQTSAVVITKPKMPLPTEQIVEGTSHITVVDTEMKAQQSLTEHNSQVEQISEDTF
ncbi:vascular endothelial growth factor receptor 1-like [Anopheles ziemanni]|uniref:vascular endothelial growth factor receptor 1-like n=1 Tax=Anopheles coustani TaxID=139045 RepID=UPI00265B4C95|nr:vascular endothelial growth factor receptor 1-like [Anopheles coustani]XP_058177550.1 vascular endothelial growth factor receptor 1-like [Anopheles ziemanni]